MLRSILIASLIISGFSLSAHGYVGADGDGRYFPTSDNRPVPWPWTLAQPFPWTDIQGLWKVDNGDFVSYFALKVVRLKSTGLRQLQVKQYDGETCKVLATGVGLERNQRVFAQMTSRAGDTYRVQLTAFSEKDAPVVPLKGNLPTQRVMVLSMGTLDSQLSEQMVHIQIVKISSHMNQKICMEDVKN